MVSLIDFGLLGGARLIFAFIFVWVIVYAVLIHTQWLGEKKNNLYALIALGMAILTIVTPAVTSVLTTMIPWVTLLIIGAVLLITVMMTVGYTQKDISRTLASKEWSGTVATWVIILVAIIILASLGSVFFQGEPIDQNGDSVQSSGSGTGVIISPDGTELSGDINSVGTGALFATLFHPKVLGFILVMMIGVILVLFLGKGSVIQ